MLQLHLGPCSNVDMRLQTDTHTDTQMRLTTIHFSQNVITQHVACISPSLLLHQATTDDSAPIAKLY